MRRDERGATAHETRDAARAATANAATHWTRVFAFSLGPRRLGRFVVVGALHIASVPPPRSHAEGDEGRHGEANEAAADRGNCDEKDGRVLGAEALALRLRGDDKRASAAFVERDAENGAERDVGDERMQQENDASADIAQRPDQRSAALLLLFLLLPPSPLLLLTALVVPATALLLPAAAASSAAARIFCIRASSSPPTAATLVAHDAIAQLGATLEISHGIDVEVVDDVEVVFSVDVDRAAVRCAKCVGGARRGAFRLVVERAC